MPIRKFENFGLPQKQPIATLDNSTIAIDGFWFIRRYLSISSQEHFNNYSLALKECLLPLVKLGKSVSIMWIWDGLEFKQPIAMADKLVQSAANKLDKGTFSKAIFDQELFVDFTTSFLRENSITVIRAPYSASAQCVYYLRESCVQYIFSKNDTLLYSDCTKLITEFEFEASSIQIFDRSEFLKINNLDLESFRRIAFLSGCEICPTHPFYSNSFDFFDIIQMVKDNTSISVLDSLGNNAEEFLRYKNEYMNAFFIVEYHPVMYLDGIVKPLLDSSCPEDLCKIFGKRQPDFIYSQIFTCALGIKVLSGIMFQKNKQTYKKSICNAFELIMSMKGAETNKNEDVYDFLIKKLETKITWDDHFTKLSQLIFMSFIDLDFDINGLIGILNNGFNGVLDNSGKVPFTHENVRVFYNINEIALLFKDLVDLAKNLFKLEGSFEYEGNFSKLFNRLPSSEILQFLTKNSKNATKVNDAIVLLEKK